MKDASQIVLTASILLLATAIAYLALIWPPERNYCLDRGGQWIAETESCEF